MKRVIDILIILQIFYWLYFSEIFTLYTYDRKTLDYFQNLLNDTKKYRERQMLVATIKNYQIVLEECGCSTRVVKESMFLWQ